MVVVAYVADGVSGRDTVQDRKTRQRGPGATASAATGDLDPLRWRALPDLDQRVPSSTRSAGSHQSRQRTQRDGHGGFGGGLASR